MNTPLWPALRAELRRAIVVAATGYGATLLALALLWSTRSFGSGWIALANVFAPWLFTPLLLLTPLALLMRSRWLRRATAGLLLLFVALCGSQIAPRGLGAAGPVDLRVVTFNTLYDNQELETALTALAAQEADVIALQELGEPMAKAVAARLAGRYPHQLLEPAAFDKGLGLISRYPLAPRTRRAGLNAQIVTLDAGKGPLTLVNVHLNAPELLPEGQEEMPLPLARVYDSAQRQAEAYELLRLIDTTAGPLVVMGDFNIADREPLYDAFAARLRDAFRETSWGFGPTFPTDGLAFGFLPLPTPLVRIDYVWSKNGYGPLAARVECASGSDHCLLAAELQHRQ